MTNLSFNRFIGIISIFAPMLHFFTDVFELYHGGFSALHLYVNYVAFILIPIMIIGLFVIQRPEIGWAGLIGALGYAIAFIYFASTVIYALIQKTPDYEVLLSRLGSFYTFNGGLMVFSGIIFGAEIIRVKKLPQWTGVLLIAGLVINLAVAFLPVSPVMQISGSIARNAAFTGMGISILIRRF